MNQQRALELAQEYYRTGASEPETVYFTTDTDDVIIVAIARVPSTRRENTIKSFQEAVRSYTPAASGQRCPRCNGTGKV